MSKNKGILLNNDFDLDISVKRDLSGLIISGMQIGNVTYQNQKLIILSSKGEFKDEPIIGVGSQLFLESDRKEDFAREIKSQLTKDGQRIKSISLNSDKINIDAEYDS